MPDNKPAQLEVLRKLRSLAESGDTKAAAALFHSYCAAFEVQSDSKTRDAFDAWTEAGHVLRRRLATFASMSLNQLRSLP